MSPSCSASHLRSAVLIATAMLVGTAAAVGAQGTTSHAGLRSAVVAVTAYDASGNAIRRGHGFFVDIGRLVTSRAVLDRAYHATVHLNDREYPVTAVLASDAEGRTPLVMLAVDLPDGCPKALRLSREPLRAGQRLTLLADEEADSLTTSVGTVLDVPELGRVVQVPADVPLDADGCPLLDDAGRVVAVAARPATAGMPALLLPTERLLALRAVRPMPLPEWHATLVPEKAGPMPPARAEAGRLMLQKDYKGARTIYARMAEQDPADVEALNGLGLCDEQLGDRARAIDEFKRALAMRPDDAPTWHRVGILSADLARWTDAKDAFRRLSALRPKDPQPLYNLAVICGASGDREAEIEAYVAVTQVAPNYVDALNNLGVIYTQTGKYEEAVGVLLRAVRNAPRHVEAQTNLGVVLSNLKRYDEAVAAFRRALTVQANAVKTIYALGVTFLRMGNRSAAEEQARHLQGLDARQGQALLARLKTADSGEQR